MNITVEVFDDVTNEVNTYPFEDLEDAVRYCRFRDERLTVRSDSEVIFKFVGGRRV